MSSPATEPSVRIIRAIAARVAARRRLVAAATLVVGALVWVASGLYTVDNGSQALRRTFGALDPRPVGPGLHLALPAGVDTVDEVATGSVRSVSLVGDDGEPLDLLTGDENIVSVEAILQYRVGSPADYLFATESATTLLVQTARARLAEVTARRTVDALLTTEKAAVEQQVRELTQRALDRYESGIVLTAVNLQSVTPPFEAAQAFRAVNDAAAEARRLINDATTDRTRTVSMARGEAQRIAGEARAGASRRRLEAEGAARRFVDVLSQHRLRPGQTRQDLFLEMARNVLPRARIVLLAPGQRPRIDINLLEAPAPIPNASDAGSAPRRDEFWKLDEDH